MDRVDKWALKHTEKYGKVLAYLRYYVHKPYTLPKTHRPPRG